jgi:hypothetical protein
MQKDGRHYHLPPDQRLATISARAQIRVDRGLKCALID